jgi:hemerythrin
VPLITLDAIPQVPLDFVNADHREEARLLNVLAEALAAHQAGQGGREPVLAAFEAVLTHTREHFAREEAAMQRTGFPPYPVHRGEHERVLAELAAEAEAFSASGDLARLERYVRRAVPEWFKTHILTMDLVTARFVVAQGGAGAGGRATGPASSETSGSE